MRGCRTRRIFGFGDTRTLIPVDAGNKITEDVVFIHQCRGRVAAAPGSDPDLVNESVKAHAGEVRGWGSLARAEP